ncbi:hypothetical protein L211DRAFT_883848 [Terfezia boudieri ATCC MYA-4762]|uniref:Uncharacterized protein n=1 Tax=Terfezia boudieri ATCC MYA-4762 TaxID=1051890 RepID=A0A3N4L985_9PEZI|nr:hypothetical protein L211DRAFT_883848 [Terfezia boudieri ATCC MYA-4762]
MNEPKEKINPADTAKKVVELTSNYETDKANLENIIKEKEALLVDITETNRQRGNKISALEKELEEVRLENRTIRQVEKEKKASQSQLSFKEAFERLRSQRQS